MTKWLLFCATALAFLGSPKFAQADTVNITVDTAALSGLSGRFEFDLFDEDGLLNNMATISNITTNGLPGPVDCTIGCTGGPPYTLDDSLGFANILLDLTLGSTFSFDLTYTNNYSFGPADQLVLFLLDPNTNFTLLDTSLDSPFGDALALITLDATQFNIQTADAGVSVTAVPEPATFLLLSLCLPMLLLRKRLLRTNA
jgi:hypothetical protein